MGDTHHLCDVDKCSVKYVNQTTPSELKCPTMTLLSDSSSFLKLSTISYITLRYSKSYQTNMNLLNDEKGANGLP